MKNGNDYLKMFPLRNNGYFSSLLVGNLTFQELLEQAENNYCKRVVTRRFY